MDLHRSHTIRESSHRVLNPFGEEKLATLGRALQLAAGTTVLDLASGKGELLCTWARDHGVTGVGVDISTVFLTAAEERARHLGVSGHVRFVHHDAATYVADPPVDLAACCGATWIGGGVAGTIELLDRSLKPGGTILIGEPYWRLDPPDEETVRACFASAEDDFLPLPGLVGQFGDLGWDVVEMVLASQDDWDRYAAAGWLNIRRFLDAHPDDELAAAFREELTASPQRHVRNQREYLGWGVFVLMRR